MQEGRKGTRAGLQQHHHASECADRRAVQGVLFFGSRGKSEADSVPLVLGAAQVSELPPHLPGSVTERAGSHAEGGLRRPCQPTALHVLTALAPSWLWARGEVLPLSGFISWSATLTTHLGDSFWNRLPQAPTRPRPSGTGTDSECCTGCSCRRERCSEYFEPRTKSHYTDTERFLFCFKIYRVPQE